MDQNDERNKFPDLFKYFDPDPERANEQFSLLRKRLMEVCRNRRIPDTRADDLVQETLVRLYAQLARIGDKNLLFVAFRILRNVILEGWRAPEMRETGFDPTTPDPKDPRKNAQEAMEEDLYDRHLDECSRTCVTKLPKGDGDLYFTYKGLSFHDRENRDSLAASMGIDRNALNVRITRIGQRLRDCIERCMQKFGLQV
jgi:DNA-directed RNA polymerase specialized sigma24 family protein